MSVSASAGVFTLLRLYKGGSSTQTPKILFGLEGGRVTKGVESDLVAHMHKVRTR